MTTPSRPPTRRLPRALRPRRRTGWVVLAALAGVLGAVVLVGLLSPVDTGKPLQQVPPQRAAAPTQPALPAPAPVQPGPRPSKPLPERPVDPDIEGPTADNRQWFRVEIVDADGDPTQGGVMPVACDGFDYDRQSGLHSAFAPSECTLEAVRRDGALFRRSEQATIRLAASAKPQLVRLVLPEERTGGIGVRFLPTSSGMRVVSMMEGGPAWEAGLEVGDMIITVDGEAVDGLDQQEFVRRMTGPEGSSVEFEILYRDGESPSEGENPVVEQVQVKRRYLDG